MRAVVAARVLAASTAFWASGAIRAEIRHEVKDGELVISNVRSAQPGHPGQRPPLPPVPSSAGSGMMPAAPEPISDLVHDSAVRYGFDPAFIRAVVAAESAFDHRAVSKAGARGLMQLMPATARQYGVRDVHDPAANLDGGVAFLREQVGRFNGDLTLALAAYNAGPEAVAKYGGVPPYEETRAYLARIRAYYGQDLQAGDRNASGHGIRLVKVEEGGVPHFTNLKSPRAPGRAKKERR